MGNLLQQFQPEAGQPHWASAQLPPPDVAATLRSKPRGRVCTLRGSSPAWVQARGAGLGAHQCTWGTRPRGSG